MTESDANTIAGNMMAWLETIKPILYSDFTVEGLSYCLAGDDFYNPISLGMFPTFSGGEVSTALRSLYEQSTQLRFEGRGLGGSKTAVVVFGGFLRPGAIGVEDFRVTADENATIASAVAALNSVTPRLRAGNGSIATFYSYANIKANDKAVRDIRA
jgi:hypothetical protein